MPWKKPLSTEGWEEKSTYRDLVELRSPSYQWGPLIFAHNTPTLKGFWDRKWRRVCEVMFNGDRWITGCANHDTVRRGNQIDHHTAAINWNFGKTLPEVSREAQSFVRWVSGSVTHAGTGFHTLTQPTFILYLIPHTHLLHNAYDNAATALWVYGFSPGLPMDFLNALMHSPWGFSVILMSDMGSRWPLKRRAFCHGKFPHRYTKTPNYLAS